MYWGDTSFDCGLLLNGGSEMNQRKMRSGIFEDTIQWWDWKDG